MTDSSVCNAYTQAIEEPVGARTLTDIRIYGTETSPVPPDYVRLIAIKDVGGGASSYPSEDNYRSDNAFEAAVDGSGWKVDTALLGDLNSCSYECNWVALSVEIQDSTRTANDECTDYNPQIEVCLDFVETASAQRSMPIYAECEAGSGRFQLLPRRLIDHDGDGAFAAILTPIQISGTGRLTGDAWITAINLVEDQGKTLRVIKPNWAFRFDEADALVDKNMLSIILHATTPFLVGAVSGGAPIVLEEVPGTTKTNFQADLTWTCGTVPPQGERHPSAGYVVSPQALGCSNGWKQQFTVRPVPYLAPSHLYLERYGHVEDREPIRLSPAVGGGYAFDHRRGNIRLRGTLSSFTANTATVALAEASVGGVNVCVPGTYTLAAE